MTRCRPICRPRVSPSTRRTPTPSAPSCARPASTRSGRRSSALTPGACSRRRSVRSPDRSDPHKEFHMDSHAVAIAAPGLPASGALHLGNRIEAAIGAVVEAAAAVILVAEVVILGAGVIARYVLHAPLVWSDELASILFLWLSMLGAVIALRRGEHMRMTAIVGRVSPPVRAFLDAVAIAAALVFLALIVYPAYEFAHDEMVITTPALEITNAWRAAALPVGSALMLLVALMRLLEAGSWRLILGALAVIGVGIGILLVLQPVLFELENENLLIFFVGIVALNVF